MKLLDLDTGDQSLEFLPEEEEAVMTMLRGFGSFSVERCVTYDRVKVGAVEFTYVNEWDEPCLIASTEVAKRMLRQIVARTEGSLIEPPPAPARPDFNIGEPASRRGWWQRTFNS